MPEISPDEIQAAAPAAAAPAAPAEPAAKPSEDGAHELPDALLKEVPALQLLMQGSPPATIASKDAKFPELDTVGKHIKDLGRAGFGVYQTKDKANVVVFNGLLVTPDEVKAADEAGTLDQIATPYEQLRSEFAAGATEAGGAAPASEAGGGVSAGVTTAAASGGAPAAPAAQRALTAERVTNLQPGSPTSGPAPGQGRILNSLLKPVV
jgi:hypothetical protein